MLEAEDDCFDFTHGKTIQASSSFSYSLIQAMFKHGKAIFTSAVSATACSLFYAAFISRDSYKDPFLCGAFMFGISLVGCWRIERDPTVSTCFATGLCAVMYAAANLPIESLPKKVAAGLGILIAYVAGSVCYLLSEQGGGRVESTR